MTLDLCQTTAFTFGDVPAPAADTQFASAVSEDRRAMTLTFSDLAVSVTSDSSAGRLAARPFSVTLPVNGDAGTAEIAFAVSGAAVRSPGTTTSLLVSVNGQSTVTDFTGDDEGFVAELIVRSDNPVECRLYALLLVGREPDGDTAVLTIESIDVEMLPRQQ